MKHKVHQVERKQTVSHKVYSKCPPLVQTQARKRVGHIGQLRHQSVTAPGLATHTADAVAAHQYHEVTVTSYLRHMQNISINSLLAEGIHSRFQICKNY